ncbi:hypothetical protein RND71_034768 [Anisodus tanguticus]|uniref:Disease resistance R13L4/SHOC-2-like LRR domain-containing protein n=1 Tax=Anisodus tanguticus TaxID=243964 RepID=A0AAE1R5W2_9SOLA|nr:hypothetical protein RND71_034768 [Anisodus tanguticus]
MLSTTDGASVECCCCCRRRRGKERPVKDFHRNFQRFEYVLVVMASFVGRYEIIEHKKSEIEESDEQKIRQVIKSLEAEISPVQINGSNSLTESRSTSSDLEFEWIDSEMECSNPSDDKSIWFMDNYSEDEIDDEFKLMIQQSFLKSIYLGMPSLELFYCGFNNLSGSISPTISNSSFTGRIPESLGNLEYLELLNLQLNNFFSDSTLSFLTSLMNCRKLRVEGCNLKGIIPKEIGNLTGVTRMNLVHNEFTGYIPNTIHGMLNLQELYLDNNKIEGTIPDVICNLNNLGAFNLSGNQFSGSVPPCLGNVTSLRKIHLAYNRLNSRLPASLGSLQDLIEFDVSSNLLSGQIHLKIGNFKAATLNDLSKNEFSEALVYLKNLNFSFNKLGGEIPTGGPFANATGQSFLSNDALCGGPKFQVSPCVIKSPKRKRKTAVLILYIPLGVGLLFLALALAYVLLRLRKIKKNAGQADVCLVKGHERISYYELEQATEGFNESNLLGDEQTDTKMQCLLSRLQFVSYYHKVERDYRLLVAA